MRPEELTIVFTQGTLGVEFAFERINAVLGKSERPVADFKLYGRSVTLREALTQLKETRKSLSLIGQGIEFDLASIANSRLDFLVIKSLAVHKVSWDEWVEQFAVSPHFVMAWVADCEYQYWQNAHDPLQYAAAGKPYQHLPLISNDLPDPLEQTVIDISSNPGRRVLRHGYIEAVGARMWLGDVFWPLTGADKKQVVETPWLQVSCSTRTVIRIQASDECFTSSEGLVGDVQSKLRLMLFPKQALFPGKAS